MNLAICGGCWVEGDAAHDCAQNLSVLERDGLWCVPCACRVEQNCRGNKHLTYVRVRVDEPA